MIQLPIMLHQKAAVTKWISAMTADCTSLRWEACYIATALIRVYTHIKPSSDAETAELAHPNMGMHQLLWQRCFSRILYLPNELCAAADASASAAATS